ncbi:MAG: lytic transglycosylase domain-containing protein [Nitrospinae bacterium]|nr:lytic transglycosylase domain-containing protein [Nitrospinota bacterium]
MTLSVRSLLAPLVAVASFLTAADAARADVYMVKDARGVVYFTNEKPTKGQQTVLKRYTFSEPSPAADPEPQQERLSPAPTAVTPLTTRSHGRSARPASYEGIIADAARRHRLDPALIKAVIKVESGFNRYSVSDKGAQGLMQLMPGTARDMQVSQVFDPADNIDGGARYLRKMLDTFRGNLRLALAAYNAGPNAVLRHGGVPPFDETRRYVHKVWSAYGAYRGGRIPLPEERAPVYYTYVDDRGAPVYTDQPRGRRITLVD